jgi:hypothetical protein
MLRSDPAWKRCSFLLVEGTSDKTFYARLIDATMCSVEVANGKQQALDVLRILEQDSVAGVLAIVDADFDVLEGKLTESTNVLLTDTHDLETMLLCSPALDKLLEEYGSQEKLAQKDIRTILLECGKPVGYLRWVSLREQAALNFEKLDFARFLSKKELRVNERELVRVLKSRSQSRYTEEDLHTFLQELRQDTHDPWHVCCGHDLIEILSVGLRSAWGSWRAQDVAPDVLERSLRLSYEAPFFVQTRLYESLRVWGETHTPFRVVVTA